jgi:hypothetical protein
MRWERVTLKENEVEAMYARWGQPCGLYAPVDAGEYVHFDCRQGHGVEWWLDPWGIKHAFVRLEPRPDGRLLEALRRQWQDPYARERADGEWDLAARALNAALGASCEAALGIIGNLGKPRVTEVEGDEDAQVD